MIYPSQLFLLLLSVSMTVGMQRAQAAVHSENFVHSGYLRAGSGTNLRGGDQVCFDNPGAAAPNEFRLGNECSIYGEVAFTAHHMDRKEDDSPYFLSQVRLAFYPPGHALFEDSTDDDGVKVVEAYAEGGRLFENLPWGFWVGKRFYRNVDLHMHDWYYFADTGGNGAGITGIEPGVGRLDVGLFFQTSTEELEFGRRQLQWLDLRWFDIAVTETDSLNLWSALGNSTGGTELVETGPTVEYDSATGWLLALRYRKALPRGFNDFTIASGNGLLSQFSLWAKPGERDVTPDIDDATRLRVVEHLTHDLGENWAYHLGLTYEHRFSGDTDVGVEDSASIGLRPVYFVNEHVQIAAEIGHSYVKRESEDSERTLTRVAIAPQLSVSRSIWGRPVLRAFYAYTMWNDANKGEIGGEAYADQTSGQSMGFQTEIWF